MDQAISIIKDDITENSRAGHSFQTYGAYHAIAALEEAGIDMDDLETSVGELIMRALWDLEGLCRKALDQ